MLLAALVAAPVAIGWALTRASVTALVGVTPTTFTLSTSGRSELRLGLAGTVYVPRARGPFGVVATVDGTAVSPDGSADLAAYVSPAMLQLYSGLFHDPEAAIGEYVGLLRHDALVEGLRAEAVLAAAGGLTLFVARLMLSPRGPSRPRQRSALAVVVAVALVSSGAVALSQVRSQTAAPVPHSALALPSLEGTGAAGSVTDSSLLHLVLEGAAPKVRKLVERQEAAVAAYRRAASRSLEDQAVAMTGPRAGETAVLMQSDMHCNTTMIALQSEVFSMLRDRYGDGVPALLGISGDLTTNGTPAEGGCIKDEAAIAQGAPVAAVTGNHESQTSREQMQAAGMTVLDGSTVELGGVRLLGEGDPERTELFGPTRLRGERTQQDVGTQLRETALEDDPQLVLVHEAYAAQAFLGVENMTTFLDGRGSPTVPAEDDVDDVPAAAVMYGHWHRDIDPRVVWNSDGTWTLVMELNTSGGAIDTPTFGRFSTPWAQPQQEASFPVLFLDDASGLVTGYQLYRFEPDGTVTVEPRVEVGGELPSPAEQAVPPSPEPPAAVARED